MAFLQYKAILTLTIVLTLLNGVECFFQVGFSKTSAGMQLPSKICNPRITRNISQRKTVRHISPSIPSMTIIRDSSFPKIPRASEDDICVVWFTGSDLRVHDNEALAAAASSKACIPVYIFDPRELAKLTKHTIASIHAAVNDLAGSLEQIGVPLVTRVGSTEQQLASIVAESGATQLLYHEDPARQAFKTASWVEESVKGLKAYSWQSHLIASPWQGLNELPMNFRDFKKNFKITDPEELAETPLALPLSSKFSDVEPVPSLDAIFGFDASINGGLKWDGEVWEQDSLYGILDPLDVKESTVLELLQEYVSRGDTLFGDAFLKDSSTAEEGLERASIKRIINSRGASGLAPGEAFSRMFALPLALGCISPKRAARCRMPPFAPTFGVERPATCWAKEAAVRNEWHTLLASKDVSSGSSTMGDGVETKYWRWNGWLTRYTVGGPDNAPVLVLVHGFGASAEQWKGIYNELKNDYKIYALDMLGFGHSQKPALSYNQYSWSNQVADFCREIVHGPFVIAGNSIGGFISASVAAEMGDLCNGLVLMNSAGRVLSKDEYQQEKQNQGDAVKELTLNGALGPYRAPPNLVLGGFATGLFYFLQGRIEGICENLYPTNPSVVKKGLGQSIFRDSCDPGATGVIAAGGKLPTPRTMNELFEEYKGDVLVVQGVLDPLNDANARADMFDQIGTQVSVVKLQAGHCPHDEQPGQVAIPIKDFLVKKLNSRSTSSLSTGAEEIKLQ